MLVVVAPAEMGWGCWGAGCCGTSVQAILGMGASGTWQLRAWAQTRSVSQRVPLGPGCSLTLGWVYQASVSFL